jgi:ATP/maltotriose-dependent transcriptional regulator MalT
LRQVRAEFAWYALEAGDTDPVALISGLFDQLARTLNGLDQSLLQKMISACAVNHQETAHFATLMCDDLKSVLQDDFYLVLDDLH